MPINNQVEARAEAIRQALCQRGATYAVVDYDGYGDSGGIETVQVVTSETPPDETHTNSLDLSSSNEEDELQELFYDLLESRFGGWENENGAFGRFVWNLRTNELKHEHNERFEDYETTEVDGWPSVEEPSSADTQTEEPGQEEA